MEHDPSPGTDSGRLGQGQPSTACCASWRSVWLHHRTRPLGRSPKLGAPLALTALGVAGTLRACMAQKTPVNDWKPWTFRPQWAESGRRKCRWLLSLRRALCVPRMPIGPFCHLLRVIAGPRVPALPAFPNCGSALRIKCL
jgi:hypothetical protein